VTAAGPRTSAQARYGKEVGPLDEELGKRKLQPLPAEPKA